ncbi:Fic family protein [Macrococcus capreoli]
MNDPYVYEGTDILKNTLGIRNKEALREFEQNTVSNHMEDLDHISYDVKSSQGIKDLHKYLFGEVYPWAGEYRTISIEKPEKVLGGQTVPYSKYQSIEKDIDNILDNAIKENPSEMNHHDFKEHISKVTADLWKVHAFREGNTRTMYAFAKNYSESFGYDFDNELIKNNPQYFRDSLVIASFYNEEYPQTDEDLKYARHILGDSIKEKPSINATRYKSMEME